MSAATLLVELLTEELPPKSLARLGRAFADGIRDGLVQRGLLATGGAASPLLATPRRLAALVENVKAQGEDRAIEAQGPSTSAPAQAVEGFARKHGLAANALEKRAGPKGEVWVAKTVVKGQSLDTVLAEIVAEALKKLPIPKFMRWGSGDAQFVRPAHGLVMLHGSRVVPGQVLGIASGNRTSGHRFLSGSEVTLASADAYAATLKSQGAVLVDVAERRAIIERLLAEAAAARNAQLGEHAELLDEVTALVELPAVYAGAFDAQFLEVPQECLILTMRQNQKYFPLFNASGKLLPTFLIVSNMPIDDPRHIVAGNQRVVRPRLEDARFFYAQDRKQRLESRVQALSSVVYHNKLGSQLERVMRIQQLAGAIAARLGGDRVLAERAAWLAKADLSTGMVGEFPELQGVMGRYYAIHDGEPADVADAIEAHYRPRFAGDRLPEGTTARAVSLADKLDALAGLFGVGEVPTGEKDPFALRRAALGVIRIVVEADLDLSLADLVGDAFEGFRGKVGAAQADVELFIRERMRGYLQERGASSHEVDAVLALNPVRLRAIPRQLDAVRAFAKLPDAANLAAANKRIGNILKKSGPVSATLDASRLVEPEEKALHAAVATAAAKAEPCFAAGDYAGYLVALAALRGPVDSFFDKVMVNAEDAALRQNRHRLLDDVQKLMNRFADISRLAS